MNDELNAAIEACKKAGDVALKYFNTELSYEDKGDYNIVSKADIECEKAILSVLQKKFPDYAYYSEEAGYSKNKNKNMWIIDPLDGTNNFAIGMPHIGVTIALFTKNGLELGTSYQPITGQLMTAIKGKGVRLNGRKVKPRNDNPQKQTISFITGYKSAQSQFPLMLSLSGKVKRMISTWAPSIDYQLIALGKIDSIISINSEAVDQLSGLVFAREAGCIIKTFEGKDYNPRKFEEFTPKLIISRNKKCYEKIKDIIQIPHKI